VTTPKIVMAHAAMNSVLRLAIRMANDYGCVGVVVDAKPGAVDFYAKYGFIQLDVLEGQSDARPQPTAMFRSTRAIQGALRTEHGRGDRVARESRHWRVSGAASPATRSERSR
jgi:hypothetical protein